MNFRNPFKKKSALPAPAVHADTCSCNQCLGLDTLHDEMRQMRQMVRASSAHAKLVAAENRLKGGSVNDNRGTMNYQATEILNNVTQKTSHSVAVDYIRRLGFSGKEK